MKPSRLTLYLPALWIASIPYGPSVASIFFVLSLISICLNPPSLERITASCKTPWFLCLMLFTAWTLLSLIWTPSWNHETTSGLKKILRFSLLPLLIPAFDDTKTQKIAIDGFIIGMLVTCALSTIKWAFHLQWYGNTDPGHLFYNHIINGFLCVFAAFCCAENYFKQDRFKSLYALAFIVLSIEILMINTGRAAYVLYAALWFYLIWQKTNFQFRIPALLITAGALILLFKFSPPLQQRIGFLMDDIQNFQIGIQSTSLGFRWQFYQFSYQLFQKQPWIGHGLGSYGYYFLKLRPVVDWEGPPNTHNQYILISVEQGLIGLGLFITVFYQWWKKMTITGRFFILLLAMNSLSDVILNACPGQLFLGIAAISLVAAKKTSADFEKKAAKASSTLFERDLHQWQHGD